MDDLLSPIQTSDGRQVGVRFLTPSDGELLVDLFQGLSLESRFHRFHIAAGGVSADELRQRLPSFVDVDGVNHVALLAVTEQEGAERAVAVARFRREVGTTDAEAAVVVRDDWQRAGVGRALMMQLVAVARCVGVKRFTAMVQGSNLGALKLVASAGLPISKHLEHGEIYIVVDLRDEGKADRTSQAQRNSGVR